MPLYSDFFRSSQFVDLARVEGGKAGPTLDGITDYLITEFYS